MDNITTVIGVIVIIAILLPLAYVQYKAKKTKQEMLTKLLGYASLSSYSISQCDTWLNFAIGIDPDKKQILYMQSGPGEHFVTIDLNNVAVCKISGDNDIQRIEKLDLMFIFKNEAAPISLSFFDDATSMQLNEELLLVKKWMQIAQTHII